MAYKARILEALDQLEKLTGAGSANHLRVTATQETDKRKLFLMYQTLREVIAKESGTTAEFTYSDKDGKLCKASSLEEAMGGGSIKE